MNKCTKSVIIYKLIFDALIFMRNAFHANFITMVNKSGLKCINNYLNVHKSVNIVNKLIICLKKSFSNVGAFLVRIKFIVPILH